MDSTGKYFTYTYCNDYGYETIEKRGNPAMESDLMKLIGYYPDWETFTKKIIGIVEAASPWKRHRSYDKSNDKLVRNCSFESTIDKCQISTYGKWNDILTKRDLFGDDLSYGKVYYSFSLYKTILRISISSVEVGGVMLSGPIENMDLLCF